MGNFWKMSEENDQMTPDKMKVAELRSALQERGLDTKGTKPVLVARLQEAFDAERAPEDDSAEKDESAPAKDSEEKTTENGDEKMETDDKTEKPKTPTKTEEEKPKGVKRKLDEEP